MNEALILSVETATLAGSIAVSRDSQILAQRVGKPEVSHSNTLLREIDEILSGQDLSVEDIDLFAVASGPGSFTGLRIGIATVKALASTLNRACLGIPTLEAITHSAGVSDATVALLPAGRGEVFVQMFSSSNGAVTALDQAQHLSPVRAIDRYRGHARILWAGEGAQLYSRLIDEARSASDTWIISVPPTALAEHVALLASTRASEGLAQRAHSLKAIYVRPSDAEMKV
jgi:tRNA threonylcarbamoyladenosine biosynthesis protein TsaB